MNSKSFVVSSYGICHKCERPYYRDDIVVEKVEYQIAHENCKAMALASGGWDVLKRGQFTLYTKKTLTGTENRYFLRIERKDQSAEQYVADALIPDEEARRNSWVCRGIFLINAVIEDRVKKFHPGDVLCWTKNNYFMCQECRVPIFESEPYFYTPGKGECRHALDCQPENWHQHKPARGGGLLFYPKKTVLLPVESHLFKNWAAVLYRERTINGSVRHYFKPINEAALCIALGRAVSHDQVTWMKDNIETIENPGQYEFDNCPRCGSNSNSLRDGEDGVTMRECRSCGYQFTEYQEK